jgi:hypothetical protein
MQSVKNTSKAAKPQAPTAKQVAEEASFQLEYSNEFTGWMLSLMRAITLDCEHENGRNAKELADLGLYLAEMQKGDVESACTKVNAGLTALEGGTQ